MGCCESSNVVDESFINPKVSHKETTNVPVVIHQVPTKHPPTEEKKQQQYVAMWPKLPPAEMPSIKVEEKLQANIQEEEMFRKIVAKIGYLTSKRKSAGFNICKKYTTPKTDHCLKKTASNDKLNTMTKSNHKIINKTTPSHLLSRKHSRSITQTSLKKCLVKSNVHLESKLKSQIEKHESSSSLGKSSISDADSDVPFKSNASNSSSNSALVEVNTKSTIKSIKTKKEVLTNQTNK